MDKFQKLYEEIIDNDDYYQQGDSSDTAFVKQLESMGFVGTSRTPGDGWDGTYEIDKDNWIEVNVTFIIRYGSGNHVEVSVSTGGAVMNREYRTKEEALEDIKHFVTTLNNQNNIIESSDDLNTHFQIFKRGNAMKLAYKISDIIDRYKDSEVGETSVPSAPDTSKFKATVGGKIRGVSNFLVRGGYYGFNRNFLLGVTIGSGIDKDTRKDLIADLEAVMKPYEEGQDRGDGGVFYIETSGTNYSTVGICNSKKQFTDKFEKELKNIINN